MISNKTVSQSNQENGTTTQKPCAWGIFYFGGKNAGKLYSQIDTEENAKRYIADLHQSNDQDTFRAAAIFTNPIPTDALRNSKMQDAVRKVLKHHHLLGEKPGDGVIEADLIYAVLDNLYCGGK